MRVAKRAGFPAAIVLVALALPASLASAQEWTWYFVKGLESGGRVKVSAAAGEYQGGMAVKSFLPHPVLWKGSSEIAIDLTPPSRSGGELFGMWGDRQVGYAASPNQYHAAAWRGSAESYVNLNPSNARASYAYATRGDQIVGMAQPNTSTYEFAALWTGPTSAYVNLHNNSLATFSDAFATDGEYQGGHAAYRASGQIHATLWHGSASTMIDVHPSWNGVTVSVINAMAPGVQVGRAGYASCLWRGTKDSARLMFPDGMYGGELRGTDGTHHVGMASKDGREYGGIWMSDDPNSFVNLSTMVASNVTGGSAWAIASDDMNMYVTGRVRIGSGPWQGIVWVRAIPSAPSAALLAIGTAAWRRKR
ncbi:MAG: hypothetical protein HUU19_09585 [Phycisphaerales bacterium]|nr:hypothetical protein [Phycisphaerales bacterium]